MDEIYVNQEQIEVVGLSHSPNQKFRRSASHSPPLRVHTDSRVVTQTNSLSPREQVEHVQSQVMRLPIILLMS